MDTTMQIYFLALTALALIGSVVCLWSMHRELRDEVEALKRRQPVDTRGREDT